MKLDIDELCNAFISALNNAGYAQKNIENYKQVSNRFKRFCSENGYDTYTVNIGQMFADNVFHEETGELVGYRHVMYGRFVRLINSFYLKTFCRVFCILLQKAICIACIYINVEMKYDTV